MSLSLPLFLLFEDTANFATAQEVMQAYKAGMLKRHRTWLQGILERYWYDPMLADHLNIPVEEVISARYKVKAIFPDISFAPIKDIVANGAILIDKGVYQPSDLAKDIGKEDIASRLSKEEAEQAAVDENTEIQKRDGIIQALNLRLQAQQPPPQFNNPFQKKEEEKPNASAAASIKPEDESAKLHKQVEETRLEVLDLMKKKVLELS